MTGGSATCNGLYLAQKKFGVSSFIVVLIAGNQFATLGLIWVLPIVKTFLYGLCHTLTLADMESLDKGRCRTRSLLFCNDKGLQELRERS